jgi:predicted GIY-YIG superfamily endonuclease
LTTWIFQCNPDHYDIDGLLASETRDILFSANQRASLMRAGDIVFIWRSQGKRNAVAGIVAKGHLLDTPSARPDVGPDQQFWVDKTRADTNQPRVKLRIDDVANKREVIQRAWMITDPILSDLTILKMANMSNYVVESEHLKRIGDLWENTGVSWSRAESIAALRAYHQTYGGSLSQKPGSPVADTASLIGRAVKGAYNKVLNFRHIDPRDGRAGFSGAGAVDREVWDEFYNPTTKEIDAEALEQEFRSLWAATKAKPRNEIPETTLTDRSSTYRPGPTPQGANYTVSPKAHEDWFVYVLELSNKKALKVGMSHEPKARLKHYNHTIMPELTGLDWKLAFTHRVDDAVHAQFVEQAVLQSFAKHQLPSNGEILRDVDATSVQLAIIKAAN